MRRIAATLAVVGALLFSAGSAWADLEDAGAAYDRGDYETAIREYRPLAEKGEASAQVQLGWLYETGEGVTENDAEAAKWYLKAAEQGHPVAQSALTR
jgi:TPR repeat protein